MHHKNIIRRKELAATISLLLATSTAVYAQDEVEEAEDQINDTEQTEEAADLGTVYVTGIRAGLQTSVDIKRNESSIVEAVSAEDIGKLPDLSIADSLARLPGVTAQRLNGRTQVISVRGLGPDFTTALLNGRQQVSTSDNRGVEFDAYPSELISAAVVYKTPDAGLMGQGLAGTVDLRTIRPLEYGERAVVANARYEWNDIDALNDDADDSGWRGSVSYVDQFADDTIGIAVGVAYLDSPAQSERYNAWGYPTGPEDALVIGGAKPFAQSNNLERTGIMGVFEWQPTSSFNTAVDVYYTDFDETQLLRGIELPFWWSEAQLQPGYTIEDGLVTNGVFDNVTGVIRNDLNRREAELWAAGWNVDWQLTDNFKFRGDLSHSEVDRTDTLLETYSGFGNNFSGPTDTIGFDLGPGRGAIFNTSLDYTSPNIVLTSPRGWGGDIVPGGQLGYNNMPTITDELTAIDLRGEWVFNEGFFSSLEFGVNYSTREKEKIADEFFLALANGALEAPLPQPTGITNLSFLGIPGMITYDPLQAIASGIFDLTRNPNADVIIKSWQVEEDVTIPFAMVNFDTLWGNTVVSGNAGIQYVDTDQSSSAISASGSGDNVLGVPTTGGASYEEWLPSLNVTFQFSNDNFIRLAYGRTLARARMDDLRAGLQWSYNPDFADSEDINQSPWGGGGGNPELRPWIADAFDVSWEKYFLDGLSYLAVAAFYKDLDSWVINVPQVYDFTGFPIGDGPEPVLRQGLVGIPTNGEGGEISGFELAGAISLAAFTDSWWGGFGAIGSASFTDSSIEDSPGNEITVPGLSEDVYNLTVYFETERFSIRASGRKRSDFLGEVAGFGNGRDFRTVQGETVVDAQASYFFGGSLQGLSLLGQVLNLTDEEFVTFGNEDERQVIDYQRYGRTFLVGLSYTFN